MFHIELPQTQRRKSRLPKKNKSKRKKKVSGLIVVTFCCPADKEYLQPNWDESVDRFDDMGLKEEVLRGIYGYGFNKPSPIQQKGILPVIQGHDTIA
jgi:hypothetical protein